MDRAKERIEHMKRLADAVKDTQAAIDTSGAVLDALEAMSLSNPFLAVVGVFLSFIELFLPSTDDLILKELKEVSDQIERLSHDMSNFFSKALDASTERNCKNHLSGYETKIMTAWKHLINMRKEGKKGGPDRKAFVDACLGGQCDQATNVFLDVLGGRGSFLQCDILNSLYKGNTNGSYYQGDLDQIASKGGYLTLIAAMGVTVQATYVSMQAAPKDQKNAWHSVQNEFGSKFAAAHTHMKHITD